MTEKAQNSTRKNPFYFINNTSGGEIFFAFLISLFTGAACFSLLMRIVPIPNVPNAISGYYAYTHDIHIANRLLSVAVFMIATLIAFLPALFVSHSISFSQNKRAQTAAFFLSCPFLIWLAGILLTKQSSPSLFWLYWETTFLWLVPFAFLYERRSERNAETAELFLTAEAFSLFIFPSIQVFLRSGIFLNIIKNPDLTVRIISQAGTQFQVFQFLPCSVILILFLFFPRKSFLKKAILFPTQLCLLLFFLLALPGVFRTNTDVIRFDPITRAFLMISFPLILIGIADIFRTSFSSHESNISAFSVLAIVIFFLFYEPAIPGLSSYQMIDAFNYEFGHRYSTIWSAAHKGTGLFTEIQDSWGLWDAFQFRLGWFFSEKITAAASVYGQYLFYMFLIIIQFFVLQRLTRSKAAAACLSLVFGYDVTVVFVIYLLIVFSPDLIKHRSRWLILWTALSMFIPFFKNPQGTMLTAAVIPFAVYQAVQLFHENKRRFLLTLIPLFIFAFCLFVQPFGEEFRGLVRMYFETGSENAAWGAVDWFLEYDLFAEAIIGNILLIFPLAALCIFLIVWKSNAAAALKVNTSGLCLTIILLSLIGLSYGFSRTDYQAYQRQFTLAASILFSAGTLLTVYFFQKRTVLIFSGLLFLFMVLQPPELLSPSKFIQSASAYPFISESKIIDAEAEYGLKNVGTGVIPRDYLESEALIKNSFDRVLEPDESFLNLTVNGSHYYITGRKVPVEYSTYYDFVGNSSELRGLDRMKTNKIQTALIDSVMLEYSPAPLRTYYFYREALIGKAPWKISEDKVILMPPAYFEKAGIPCPDTKESLEIFDTLFPTDILHAFPSVLGRNPNAVLKGTTTIQTVTAKQKNSAAVQIIPSTPINGSEAGLLRFDLKLKNMDSAEIVMTWTNGAAPDAKNTLSFIAENGTMIVPADVFPRWILAESISEINLSAKTVSSEKDSTQEPVAFQISSVEFISRADS